jgi:hypothetical protein
MRSEIVRFRGSIPPDIRMWLRNDERRRVLVVLVAFALRNCRITPYKEKSKQVCRLH